MTIVGHLRNRTLEGSLREQLDTMRGFLPNHEPSDWLRGAFADVDLWPAACRHIRTGEMIGLPAIAPLWDGGAWCTPCAPVAFNLPEATEAQRCDRCRYEPCDIGGDKVWVHSILAGSILMMFGLCIDCLRKEAPHRIQESP